MSAPAAVAAVPQVCSRCTVHAETVFRIDGMCCGEEAAILRRRLHALPGVEDVAADIVGQRLHVKYDAARLSGNAIVDAVAQTGMRAWLEQEHAATPPRSNARIWLVGISGAALATGLLITFVGASHAAAIAAYLIATATGAVYPARRAYASLRSRELDIHVLMLVAVVGALVLREWAEAATVVFLFAIAQWLEARSLDRARAAIRALMDLAPDEARVRHGDHEEVVPVERIQPGTIMLIRPGEKIPLDGEVSAGRSDVNQAPITGESLPVDKAMGDVVFAGTINGHGALEVTVTRLRRDSTMARIIHLVETAQAQRAPAQQFIDRFARWYTPAVLVVAIAIAALPPLFGAPSEVWLYRALVLLVVSCPCALVISTPVSIVSALAGAARRGVLVKGGAHLERLAAVRAIAFDKTGTLTRASLQVVDVLPAPGLSRERVLELASAVESRSEHPIARAIVDATSVAGVTAPSVTDVRALPGLGAQGDVRGATVLCGNLRLFRESGIATEEAVAAAEQVSRTGASAVLVALDGTFVGAIAIADEAREVASDAIALLHEQGLRPIVMLTGDHELPARAMASRLRLDEVHAGLLPHEKVEALRRLQQRHGVVAMVGDGINDAPALAVADVGIVMGAVGSDAALETADVALMTDELPKIAYAVRLSRATVRNIRLNVAVSLALKAAFLLLAISGVATLWMAVVADTGTSLIVIANAMRLLRQR